jgi:hypothetical protein
MLTSPEEAGAAMSMQQKVEAVGSFGSDLDEYVAQLIRCEKLSENGIRMICDKVETSAFPSPFAFACFPLSRQA